MTETERIADQLWRSQHGVAWHGPALGELLKGVDSKVASHRGGGGTHTIWEIVHHITAWQKAAMRAANGERMAELDGADDWPPPGATEEEWNESVAWLEDVNRGLCAAIGQFAEERLSEIVPGRDYSFYFLFHGVVQHNLYHGGQIALLKKLA